MKRIESKHIDNSQLVPTRIAEQKTTYRQREPIAPDLSGAVKGLQAAANLVNNIADFQTELNREMDELAEIKIKSLFENQRTLALQGLDNKNPNDELYQSLPTLRQNFYDNVQNGLNDIPMSKKMKKFALATLNAESENLGVSLERQFQRKQLEYINNENLNYMQLSIEQGDTDKALHFYDLLTDRGAKLNITREEVKSNATFNVLKEAIDLSDYSVITELEEKNTDGKYSKFPELIGDARTRLIQYGKNKKADNYNTEISNYAQLINQSKDYDNMLQDLENNKNTMQEDVYQGKKALLLSSIYKKKENETKQAQATAQHDKEFLLGTVYFNSEKIAQMSPLEKAEAYKKDLKTLMKLDIPIQDKVEADKKLRSFYKDTVNVNGNTQKAPETKYRDSFIYQNAMEQLKKEKNAFGYTDGFWSTNDAAIKAANYGMAKLKLDEFIKNNPNATMDDVSLFIKNIKTTINNTKQTELIQTWTNMNIPQINAIIPIDSGTTTEIKRLTKDGRIAIFDQNKKFLRYEDETNHGK